jgi:hypothetical protein
MSVKYSLDIDEDLARRLQQVDSEVIVEQLEELAEDSRSEVDELAQYDRVKEIRDDDSISKAEQKRRAIRAQRRSDGPVR